MICQSVVSSVLFFCILALIHGAVEDSSNIIKKPKPKCSDIVSNATGKVEFNGKNASINCNFTLNPPENETVGIYLLLQKLILDDGDQVRILGSDSKPIFPPFHAQEHAILLVTNVKELVIQLLTSPRVVQREFAVSYQAQDCSFTIDDNIPSVTHPIYAPNSRATDCEYIFEPKTNVSFAFSFESFNLSVAAIKVIGAAKGNLTFSKNHPPHDFFSGHDQVSVVASFDPKHPSDEFILKKRDVYVAKKNPKCNDTVISPSGKVEFNGKNASINCNFTLNPPKNGSVIHLLLQKLILDDGDKVIILGNDSKPIFPPFHAQEDAILLVTNVKELIIQLLTSPRVVQREFAVSYHAQVCTFKIDDDIPAVTHPIYAPNSTTTECEYIFEPKTNVSFAFSFESFNLSVATIEVKGAAEGPSFTFSKQYPPQDFISGSDQVSVVASFDPEHPSDEFILKKRDVYAGCSGFKTTNAMETIISPPLPSVLDSSLPTECVWHIRNSIPNQALGLKFKTLHLKNVFDVIAVCDGSRVSVPPFLQITYNNQGINLASEIRTSASEMIISFNPVTFASNFTADVFNAGDGRYLKDNGTLRSSPGRDENVTIFLLEVADGKNVVLNFKDSSFASPASLHIYEGFSTKSRKIATLYGNVWYPVISPTSRMMLAANDFKAGHFEAEFNGSSTGCMHMSPGSSDSYILSGNCNSSCSWIIPPIDSKDDLHLDIQYADLQKDDLIQILDKNKMIIANITVNVTHVPEFSFKSQDGAYLKVTRGACPKKETDIILVARSNYLPSCSRNSTLSPYKLHQLTSPNYPNTYPLLSHCKVNITRSSPAQLLHVAFSELDLAPNHCIKVTQIMKNGTSVFDIIGNQMPGDFLYVGDIVIEFNTESCDKAKGMDSYITKQGFVINMTSTDCGNVFEGKKTGEFSNDGNKTLCIWMVTVPAKEKDDSVNIITYTTAEDKTGNYKFTVYDGPSVRSSVIENNTESEIWSSTNALIFVYERLDLSKPSSKITVNYKTKNCDKSMQCDNNLCMHPDWRCNGKNDCGDFSDERNCAAVPTEKLPPPGIEPVVFGICSVLFFFIGVAVTLLTPWAIQKYRNRYHQFSDLSVIE